MRAVANSDTSDMHVFLNAAFAVQKSLAEFRKRIAIGGGKPDAGNYNARTLNLILHILKISVEKRARNELLASSS